MRPSELAKAVLASGYKTASTPDTFLIAVSQELRRNRNFERISDGKHYFLAEK
jgi:hypothetical protein